MSTAHSSLVGQLEALPRPASPDSRHQSRVPPARDRRAWAPSALDDAARFAHLAALISARKGQDP
jgi:hypothetical protein